MNLNHALALLAREPAPPLDLAELALCLARDEYKDLDVEASLGELSAMAHEAASYLRGDLTARVTGLCRYLFHDMGFRGNLRDYYDPRNSYLNEVLDRRTGIPLSLSVVVLAIGARVGLELAGVGLPGHFIVKALEDGHEVLFDPFHGGRILSASDCELLVRQVTGMKFQADSANLQAAPLGAMVLRMLSNLKAIYLNAEDFPRAIRIIERIRQLQPNELLHRRDLAVCLLRASQPGKAIDHFTAYLSASPPGQDAEVVRGMLRKARGLVAQWN